MQQRKVLLIEDNLGDARLVQETLADAESSAFVVHKAESLLAGLEALARESFDVALVDLSLPDSAGLETLLTIQRHAPQLPIVVLTGFASDSLALSAVQRGAQDYLVKGSITPESLTHALQYAIVRRPVSARVAAEPARVVGLLGAKGGVGTTTLACHYAADLHAHTGKKILLMDLDASAASAAFLLKAQSEHTILDASKNLHRLDASLWDGMVCGTARGVDLLRSPGIAGCHEQLNGERVRHVLRFVRPLYSYVVIDLGRLNALTLQLMEEIGDLVLVTTQELPSLYETGLVLTKLAALGRNKSRTHLVINRSSGKLCPVSDFERALGYGVSATFGDYSGEMHERYSEGQFLDEKLQLRKQMRRLVSKSLGVEEPKEPGRMKLGRFRLARA